MLFHLLKKAGYRAKHFPKKLKIILLPDADHPHIPGKVTSFSDVREQKQGQEFWLNQSYGDTVLIHILRPRPVIPIHLLMCRVLFSKVTLEMSWEFCC